MFYLISTDYFTCSFDKLKNIILITIPSEHCENSNIRKYADFIMVMTKTNFTNLVIKIDIFNFNNV